MTDMLDQSMMEVAPATALARKIPTAELAVELLERARCEGAELVGPGGFLAELTKRVLEAGLEAEMTEHVGYEAHDPVGHHSGNSRNGTRTKTVITDIGRCRLMCPGTGRGRLSRSSSGNGSAAWAGSIRWSCRCLRRG